MRCQNAACCLCSVHCQSRLKKFAALGLMFCR
ncbi:MAG: hypothetical protein D8H92_08240 [Campylobacter sp.]|nr:MAG: hypothetical protein D8H92_08240 [Campylobacter sp.]